jgi:hypothetical protein
MKRRTRGQGDAIAELYEVCYDSTWKRREGRGLFGASSLIRCFSCSRHHLEAVVRDGSLFLDRDRSLFRWRLDAVLPLPPRFLPRAVRF